MLTQRKLVERLNSQQSHLALLEAELRAADGLRKVAAERVRALKQAIVETEVAINESKELLEDAE